MKAYYKIEFYENNNFCGYLNVATFTEAINISDTYLTIDGKKVIISEITEKPIKELEVFINEIKES